VLIGTADTHVGGTGSHWDQSAYLVSHLPTAELHAIDGAKHGFFWSASERVVEILAAWIDRIDASRRAVA
jgi:pimeloyl-ACP methyl ester carboxylesterase